MIYFDNSATTYPKPLAVRNAVNDAIRNYSANPGRSGHSMSLKAAQKMFDCRTKAAEFFNVDSENNIILTSGCTFSLNCVIKGILKSGDHAVISCLEHNSVTRPLEKLKAIGVTYSIANVYECDDDKTLSSFRECINERTRLIICTHASNVFGIRLPVERICALAHQYGILFCLDAAQSAGVMPIDVKENNYDYVCIAGHKGLYGPMGTGMLIINSEELPDSLVEGGTGSESSNQNQPLILPDRYESGTMNIPGICGLAAGIDFVSKTGVENIAKKEHRHIERLYSALSNIDKVKLYTQPPTPEYHAPVLSFSVDGQNSEDVAQYLESRYSIAVRSGLHCSPLAHRYMNTDKEGTVRISPSVFTTENDIATLIFALRKY